MDLDITREGVVVPVRVDPGGIAGPTPGQARGPGWRRTSAGLFVPAAVDGSVPEQRIVEAIAGSPAGSAVTGWAALRWSGARWFPGHDGRGQPMPVPIALGDRKAAAFRAGAAFSYDWLFDDDITWLDGVPITIAERSISFAVRRARSDEQAVQIIDTAAQDDLIDLESLAAYAARLTERKGVRRLNRAIALADENAWSPMEVTMRLRWQGAGRPRPQCNVPIFDLAGNHLITPDLFDPEAGVAGEYDGVVHIEEGPRRRDLNRDELYRELGLEVVTMMSTDLRDTTDFLRRLEGAYRRAAGRAPSGRWTLEQPPWWVDTSTVAKRRALDDLDREIWLRRGAS